MDQGYAVQSPERMVADCDECTFGQIVKHLFVVDSKCVVELLEQQPSHKVRAGGVAACRMHRIDLVDRQEMQKPVHKLRVSVEFGHHSAYVVVIEYVRPYSYIIVGHYYLAEGVI